MSRGLSPRVALLVAQTVLLAAWIASASNWVENMGIAEGMKANLRNGSDIGKATKCDPSDPVNVEFSWEPKDLSPSDQVKVTVSYTVRYFFEITDVRSWSAAGSWNVKEIVIQITAHSFNHGVLNMSLYFHGEPEPFLGYTNTISCSDLDPKIVKCPVRKRMHMTVSRNVPNLHPLTSFPGHYDVIIDLKNEDNLEMFCLNITLDIKEI